METFEWRISAAPVVEDGPFSKFEGVDRKLVITEGAGLQLDGLLLQPLVVHSFAGDSPPTAALVDGPIRDFGVMTRRKCWSSDMRILRNEKALQVDIAPEDNVFVHMLAGQADYTLRRRTILPTGHSIWIKPRPKPKRLLLTVVGKSAAILVHLKPALQH